MFSYVKGHQLRSGQRRGAFKRLGKGARSVNWEKAMSYRIVFWSAVGWVALCLAPYVYALNDLITWR